uniref:(northern house mosquito) hypothetical protein n=1 Tax=Culex pipiens TaxID=7175 RepID=A0A8D8KCX9_CULPI
MLSCYMLLLFVFRLNCVHNLAVRSPKAFEESRVHQSDVRGQHLFQQSWGTIFSVFRLFSPRDPFTAQLLGVVPLSLTLAHTGAPAVKSASKRKRKPKRRSQLLCCAICTKQQPWRFRDFSSGTSEEKYTLFKLSERFFCLHTHTHTSAFFSRPRSKRENFRNFFEFFSANLELNFSSLA